MIAKYESMMDRVHQHIYNALHLDKTDDKIIIEVLDKFPIYVAFPRVDSEMLDEFIYHIVKSNRKTFEVTKANIESIYSCNVIKSDPEDKSE